jgi:hypothetical protein
MQETLFVIQSVCQTEIYSPKYRTLKFDKQDKSHIPEIKIQVLDIQTKEYHIIQTIQTLLNIYKLLVNRKTSLRIHQSRIIVIRYISM